MEEGNNRAAYGQMVIYNKKDPDVVALYMNNKLASLSSNTRLPRRKRPRRTAKRHVEAAGK
jgi:hypothetical protein